MTLIHDQYILRTKKYTLDKCHITNSDIWVRMRNSQLNSNVQNLNIHLNVKMKEFHLSGMKHFNIKNAFVSLKSLWPVDAIWRHRSASTCFSVIACFMTSPKYYPCDTDDLKLYYKFETYIWELMPAFPGANKLERHMGDEMNLWTFYLHNWYAMCVYIEADPWFSSKVPFSVKSNPAKHDTWIDLLSRTTRGLLLA